ncbi:hypothetical protein [Streptomyces sp.]|uniref:hypothetical protein n=1 Tax=Streptomyces sp. TaxID=1931 RepID=UPI002F94173F
MGDQVLPGVPAKIGRADLVAAVESLGFDLRSVVGLDFHRDAVYATVFASHPDKGDGWRYAVDDEVARHRICVPIVNEAASAPTGED